MRQPATSTAALMPRDYTRKDDELVGTSGMAKIANEQAKAKLVRGQRKRSAKAAADHLAGYQGIILGHIHPRWLRDAVAARLDLGNPVTEQDVAELRARGPL